MHILLDECVPRPLRRELADHVVRTATEMGWSGKKNGDLLRLMDVDSFGVLLTVDRNLPHQQDYRATGMAIVVLVAPSNRLVDLLRLMPSARIALDSIMPGDLVEIQA